MPTPRSRPSTFLEELGSWRRVRVRPWEELGSDLVSSFFLRFSGGQFADTHFSGQLQRGQLQTPTFPVEEERPIADSHFSG